MTLAELRSSFLSTLNRRDVTPVQVSSWLNSAIQRAQRLLRVPAQEKTIQYIVKPGFTVVPVPGDHLRLISISACGDELEVTDATTVRRMTKQSGRARFYVRDGSSWILGPHPRNGDQIFVTYAADAGQLVSEGDRNWLSEIAPEIIIHGALSQAFLHFADVRREAFEAEFVKGIADLNLQAVSDELVNATVAPSFRFDFDD